MDAQTLKTELTSLLADQLGTYTISGQQVPAISIIGGQVVRGDTGVNGLECVIRPTPDWSKSELYGAISPGETYQLYLIQWYVTSAEDLKLREATRRILQRYVGAEAVPTVPDPNQNILEEVSIRIPVLDEYLEAI